jgi:hypothetical protein
MKTGVELIAEERQKQIDKHGFTAEHHVNHDVWYENFQLQLAAVTLLMHEFEEQIEVEANLPEGWELEWFLRLNAKDRRERLIIAGALIAAELDRIDYPETTKS